MGWYFRRSVNVGPFRVNMSRAGLGWSVGGRGFRTGRSARGRRYSTFSLPGTGVGYRTSRGCALALFAIPAAAVAVVGAVLIAARAAGVFA